MFKVNVSLTTSSGKPVNKIFDGIIKKLDGSFKSELFDIGLLFQKAFGFNFIHQGSYLGAWQKSDAAEKRGDLTGIDTGLLFGSVTNFNNEGSIYDIENDFLKIGTSIFYAKFFNDGTKKNMPARPFLVISPDTLEAAGGMLLERVIN